MAGRGNALGAAAIAAAGVLAWPAPAPAGHGSACDWGVTVWFDATRPWTSWADTAAPIWGCQNPTVTAAAALPERQLVVEGGAEGVRWSTSGDQPEAAGTPTERESAPLEPARLRLRVLPRTVRAGDRVRFRFDAAWAFENVDRRPASGVTIRFAGRRARTASDGRTALTARVRRAGIVRVVARQHGRKLGGTTVRVLRAGRRR